MIALLRKRHCFVLAILVLTAYQPVFAQPDPAPSDAIADIGEGTSVQVWTCPMHRQVQQASSGKCPICAMELTPLGTKAPNRIPDLMSLEEMLSVALKHNPDMRAAEARVRSAEADFDRTRLKVVQSTIAFREKWQTQQFALRAAERESAEAARQEKLAREGTIAGKELAVHNVAREKLAFQRAKLAEVEAELPFLLGEVPGTAVSEASDPSRFLIEEQLLPKARQILELRTREYQTGNASVLDVAAAHRQLLELETRLAHTNKQKIVAIESQKRLVQNTLAVTQQMYKAGQASQGDVLAIDLELSELDLRLLELKRD